MKKMIFLLVIMVLLITGLYINKLKVTNRYNEIEKYYLYQYNLLKDDQNITFHIVLQGVINEIDNIGDMVIDKTTDDTDLSDETLEWLIWFNTLDNDQERLSINYIPTDLARIQSHWYSNNKNSYIQLDEIDRYYLFLYKNYTDDIKVVLSRCTDFIEITDFMIIDDEISDKDFSEETLQWLIWFNNLENDQYRLEINSIPLELSRVIDEWMR